MIKLILAALVIILQIADGWLTYENIGAGRAKEGNPVLAWLFKTFGMGPVLIVIKAAVAVLIWAFYSVLSALFLFLIVLLYLFVGHNNYKFYKS